MRPGSITDLVSENDESRKSIFAWIRADGHPQRGRQTWDTGDPVCHCFAPGDEAHGRRRALGKRLDTIFADYDWDAKLNVGTSGCRTAVALMQPSGCVTEHGAQDARAVVL